jgi:iron(III) transport system substrate-binding protein
MKSIKWLLVFCVMIILLIGCNTNGKEVSPTNEPTTAVSEVQDWAAIEAAAKEEGKVVVYASSSRIEDQIEMWKQKYPDITLEGYDMGDIALKMAEEQKAGNVVGDVWFNSEGELLLNELLPKGYILPFIPDEFKDALPVTTEQPFAIQRYGGDVWGYNIEQNPDGCPVTNWWQFVNGKYDKNIYLEDPLSEADKIGFYVTVIAHGDEMAEAYLAEEGKEWTTDPDYGEDTPNAGWLWVKKFAKSPNLVLMPGGDEVIEAMASKGMTETAGMAMTSYSKIRDTVAGEIAFGACEGIQPALGTSSVTYLGIANNAAHPNAAKLYIKYALTEEGREPWNVLGNWPGRTDLAAPEGAPAFSESGLWPEDYIAIYQQASQVRDFWTLNALVK